MIQTEKLQKLLNINYLYFCLIRNSLLLKMNHKQVGVFLHSVKVSHILFFQSIAAILRT